MPKKNIVAIPHNEGWAVMREGHERASRVFATKAEATTFGRELARKGRVEFIIPSHTGGLRRQAQVWADATPSGDPIGVTELLGGEHTLGVKARSSADLIPAVREGLKYGSLGAFVAHTGLSQEQVLGALGLPLRTIARRKAEERLKPAESDRVYRLARIVARTEEVLGEMEKTREWLLRPNRALGQVTPLSLLDTDEGARQVEAVLGRIEHGVWS